MFQIISQTTIVFKIRNKYTKYKKAYAVLTKKIIHNICIYNFLQKRLITNKLKYKEKLIIDKIYSQIYFEEMNFDVIIKI